MARLLIVDDDPLIGESLSLVIRKMGHDARLARTVREAADEIASRPFDIAFCDVRMPDGSGLDILPEIRKSPAAPEVIIMTGFGDPDGAELAIKKGAWDYVQKPLTAQEIRLTIERALQYREKKKSVPPMMALNLAGIIGNSPPLKPCFDGLAQAASSESNVLISGETGTGKELFARAIHRNGSRSRENFVVVDCAALPETLVESTLFGHLRGAFTGADKPRDGLVKQADGGTLFLDEVGELSISVQKAFLRVLQERRFRPVGGGSEIKSDFRLVAATNRNLEGMAGKGAFREDLLFRLRTLVIDLPPLRACRDDIKDLALHYIAKACEQSRVAMKGMASAFLEGLTAYDWPGNIRELVQALEKAVVTAGEEPMLFPVHLPDHIRIRLAAAAAGRKKGPLREAVVSPDSDGGLVPLHEFREAGLAGIEREYLDRLMKNTGGDISKAARISGLSRSRLYTLLKKRRIPPSA
ncbi:MAG: sigma-54 dependent transcriptional regulator [Candidatus Aminicenantes bacterium]|nr:sigma-54 dependent transcriptional regulator [Candidatus Aminicenantes bacterium]